MSSEVEQMTDIEIAPTWYLTSMHLIAFLTAPLNILGVLLIIFVRSPHLKSFRCHLLSYQLISYLTDFSINAGSLPVVYFPFAIGRPYGFSTKLFQLFGMETSTSFQTHDEEFDTLKRNLRAGFENTGLLDIFCPVEILESKYMKWRQDKIFAPFKWVHELCKRNIAERVAQIENGEHILHNDPTDFLDAYLMKMEKDKRDGLETSFTLENLSVDLYDLWIAGQETTSTTLTWACLCLLNHPEVLVKARKELVHVTGGHRSVSLIDKKDTPYLNAIISECQRVASILNVNLFRILEEDTVIDGQPIRAGTALTAHISLIHVDEDLFKNHTEFRPERFIESEGLDKKLIPFGIGKRACLGESLAKAELYLVLGNMLQDYDMKPVGELPAIKTITPFGLLKKPPQYEIQFVPVIH